MINSEINITLNDVMEKVHSSDLKNKIQHSITTIQKGFLLWEKFYKDRFPITLAFSGGKDSQVLYHLAKIALSSEQWQTLKVFMSLTSIDPPSVIRFVKTQYPDVKLERPHKSIYQVAIDKKLLPTMISRWCCVDFKENKENFSFIGIRKQESSKRAKRNEVELTSHKFTGDFKKLADYREEVVAKNKNRKRYKDYFDNHEETEVGCLFGKDKLVISPCLEWTDTEVWFFLNDIIKAEHCELYDEGYTRIGCIACPMATVKRRLADFEKYPHAKKRWLWVCEEIIKNQGYLKFAERVETELGITDVKQKGNLLFEWWLSMQSIDNFITNRSTEFKSQK